MLSPSGTLSLDRIYYSANISRGRTEWNNFSPESVIFADIGVLDKCANRATWTHEEISVRTLCYLKYLHFYSFRERVPWCTKDITSTKMLIEYIRCGERRKWISCPKLGACQTTSAIHCAQTLSTSGLIHTKN